MSKLIKERWNKLAFGIDLINEDEILNEAKRKTYPKGAKKYQKAFLNYLDSISLPKKTAAGEDIMPSGTSGGYAYEGLLKSSLEDERKKRFSAGSQKGMATLDSPTLKFDLSLNVASMTTSGLKFKIDTDKTGTNNPNRVIKAEVKSLPAQFGQFKKGQVATFEFDGTELNWTHHSDTAQGEQDRINNLLDNLNSPENKTWFVDFLGFCNDQMGHVHKILEKGFEEFVAKNDTKTGVIRVRKTKLASILQGNKASLQLNPFVGNLDKIDLLESLYQQLGAAYKFDGFKNDDPEDAVPEQPTEDTEQNPPDSDQSQLDFSHYSLKGNLLQEKFVPYIPRAEQKNMRGKTGKLKKKQGWGHLSGLNKLMASDTVGEKIAHFAMKGGDTTEPGFAGNQKTGPGSFEYSGTAWRDYMAQTKDIVIFGTGGKESVEGKVYALHHKIPATKDFDQFNFPGTVKVGPRFESGHFRMETNAKLLNVDLPSNGHSYNNAKELYDILVGWDHYYSERYNDQGQIKRSTDPIDTSMGSGSYQGIGQDGQPLMAHRKRKYSIASKLLGE